MAHIAEDRVQETSTSTGTGNLTLAGAVAGYVTFASVMANNDTCWYAIVDSTTGDWETGLGTFVSATPALARTTVLESSNAGAAVSFAAGTKNIFITPIAAKTAIFDNVNAMKIPAVTAEPVVPSAGFAMFYAKDIAGRTMPKWVGPSGVDSPIQYHVGFNNCRLIRGNSTVPVGTSTSSSSVTTTDMQVTYLSGVAATSPALATTNLKTATRRRTLSTAATAGSLSYIRGNLGEVWRGNAAGQGGFFMGMRFGLATLQSGMRGFFGLVDVQANPTNIDPTTTSTPGGIGLAINASTGNWNLVNNITGTARTSLGLGASFPVNTTDLLELILFSKPNGSDIGYRVTNLSTGAQTSGTLTTNIPATTTFLTPSMWITNNATAAAATWDFVSCYLETDY